MADYSTKTYQEIADLLEAQGSRIGSFHQGSFATDVGQRVKGDMIYTQSGIGGKSLGSGFCAGVCLDWARRVLLSRPDRNQAFLNYGYDKILKGEGTRDGRSVTDSKDRAFQTVGRMAVAWNTSSNITWTGGTNVTSEEWTKKAASLDASFNKDRATEHRGKSAKPFSSLTVIASKSTVYSAAGYWMAELLANGLSAGAVSKLGFRRPTQSGHAIAVWQRKTSVTDPDSFYLFDPNYGVFSYKQTGLQSALQILFWMDDANTPKYVNCCSATAQEMDYIKFGPPNVVNAIAVPVAKTVVPSVVESPAVKTAEPAATKTSSPAPLGTGGAIGSANMYGAASHSLTSPGLTTSPVSTASSPKSGTTGKSALKAKLIAAMNDPSKHRDKQAGVATEDGLGYVRLEQDLCKEIIAAKIVQGNAGLKGVSPMGDWLMKGTLKQIIALLG